MKILFFLSFLVFNNILLAQGKKAQIKALTQKIMSLESIIKDQNVMIREQFKKLQNENEQILSKLTVIQLTTDSILKSQNVGINLNNISSSPLTSENPFGDGGNGGGNGEGNGPFDGNGKGTSGEGDGFGDGKSRIRINDPIFPKYNTDVDLKIHLKLTVSGDGAVSTAVCIKSKTTTTDQTIINDVIRQVIRQVKYKKDPEGRPAYCYLTVNVNAQ